MSSLIDFHECSHSPLGLATKQLFRNVTNIIAELVWGGRSSTLRHTLKPFNIIVQIASCVAN
ncbi:hypothetical protein DY000_02035477 [Brassica cretica]|uniref:Uncharacterized protein n=1 Tax=Brassica cretica TaxID=69181 RepID=A0ABQ7DKS0_BRACR|nr:hypothetical protein DY000_02035477 [Brassica cretica]